MKIRFFSEFPVDMIREIRGWAKSDVSQALEYAAHARKEDVKALLNMLNDNPELLLQRAVNGDVKARINGAGFDPLIAAGASKIGHDLRASMRACL